MSKSISARRKGDDYQSRFFWNKLLSLRLNDYVKEVTIESETTAYIDDVEVKYEPYIKDQTTGNLIYCDYYQCKYHVAHTDNFTSDNLIDPNFINAKTSMLQRLHHAYSGLYGRFQGFRLYIVSSYGWDSHDIIANYIGSEGELRQTFYTDKRTEQIRSQYCLHLGIDENSLNDILLSTRFILNINLTNLLELLNANLKAAGLKKIDLTTATNIYDDLIWKLFSQGKHVFTKDKFDLLIDEEHLADLDENVAEISIRSFKQHFRRPVGVLARYLDLSEYFEERYIREPVFWNSQIVNALKDFYSNQIAKLSLPIHLFFDCHLSIAFYLGHLNNPKYYGINIQPIQKLRSDFELWFPPDNLDQLPASAWNTKEKIIDSDECILSISISNTIEPHLLPVITTMGLDKCSQIFASPQSGIGQNGIKNRLHAWGLGFELQRYLKQIIPASCRIMHVFLSCPAAMSYILGNLLRNITPTIQLYEHDFEGKRELRYSPSITI